MVGGRLVWFRSMLLSTYYTPGTTIHWDMKMKSEPLSFNTTQKTLISPRSARCHERDTAWPQEAGRRALSRMDIQEGFPEESAPPWTTLVFGGLGHSSWSCLSPIIYQLSLQGLLCLEAQALR